MPGTLADTGVPRVQPIKSPTGKNGSGALSLAATALKTLAASVNSRLDVLYRLVAKINGITLIY